MNVHFYVFLLDEFGMLSRRAVISATAELSCFTLCSVAVYSFPEISTLCLVVCTV